MKLSRKKRHFLGLTGGGMEWGDGAEKMTMHPAPSHDTTESPVV